jgi:hypothetical protein
MSLNKTLKSFINLIGLEPMTFRAFVAGHALPAELQVDEEAGAEGLEPP